MKRMILILFALMVSSTSSFGLVSTVEIFKRILYTIDQLESFENQILFTQMNNIRKNSISTQIYTLSSGSSYTIFAFGDDERVMDIDLTVLDENNNVIGKDTDDTNIAIVDVRPKWSGDFKIQVSAYRMKSTYNDAFYGIIIARND